MEFSHRGPVQAPQTTSHVSAAPASSEPGKKSRKSETIGFSKWLRITSVVLLFSITILVISIASLLYFGNGNESKFVDTSKFQAVDLNVGSSGSGDQIYFGHVKKLNDKYLVLQDIYYIVPNQQGASGSSATANNNYTLVKLGCELHAPYDQMVVNRDHVVFWENLKASGTVVTKINEYVKQNPNGPDCSAQSTNAAASSSSAAAPATTTPTTTTTTTPTTTTKKP